jgi:hypothetical protein
MVVLSPDETVDSLSVVRVLAYFEIGVPEVNTTHAAGTAWGSGAITSGAFASGAITAAAIAADAIGASELAADAVSEIAAAISVPSAATIADAVWDEDATAHQTQGTFGQAIGDPASDSDSIWALVNTNLNATVSSRASQTSVDTMAAYIDTEVAAIKAKTDQLTFTTANRVDCQVYGMQAGTITATVIATDAIDADALATDAVNELVDQVWDEVLADHLTAGSMGAALNAAGSAGDPWTTSLPGSYVAGQAGYIVGNSLDAADVRSALGMASADLDTQLDALPTAAEIWTATLTQAYAADGAEFTPAQALYMIWSALSEFAISGATITCKRLNGTTTSMTFTLDDATTPTSRTRAT